MRTNHRRSRSAPSAAAVIAVALALAACGPAEEQSASQLQQQTPAAVQEQPQAGLERYRTWRTYSGGGHASQYSALDQINQSNVAELEVVWTYPNGGSVFNPIVVDDVMYVLASQNALVALDARTGEEIWTKPHDGGITQRGVNYWQSEDGSDRRLLYLNSGYLTATDADTGETITSFGDNGRVDFRVAMGADGRNVENVRPLNTSNPGRVIGDRMVVSLPAQGAGFASTPGDVHAYDVVSGELEWVFHAIPHPGEFGYETWPEGAYLTAGGVHNWSELTVDEDNGIVFVPFGSPRYDFFGGDREGDNLYGNTLVAINAETGERIWHQQLVHHDLWDFDLPQAPKLLTIDHDGARVDVVAQASKQGFLFVFDRLTGEPIWPIEERPVPQSDLPGEYTSPTQPFPTLPPPFAVQAFTEADINPYLPEQERQALAELLRNSRNDGLFTPPSFEGSISMPGHNGGANWASAAVDPINGEFYVISKNLPVMLRAGLVSDDTEPGIGGGGGATRTLEEIAAMRAEAEASLADGVVRYGVPYQFLTSQSTGLSVYGPPWSHLTAYDLNTGEIKWRIANGSTTGRIPNGDSPAIEVPESSGAHMPRGAPLVTAGGLLFVATAQDRKLRAYDRDSGEVIWSYDLPGGSEGIPATYEIDGRQYLAVPVNAGAGGFAPRLETGFPDAVNAYMVFALPN